MRTVLATAVLAFSISAFAEIPPVPRPAKELTIVEPSGKQSLLSQYKGKVCVIQFLFTTCPHCQKLSQELTKLQGELGPGVQMLGVAFDEANAAKAAGYVRQFNVGFPVGFADRTTVLNYLGLSVMDRFVVPQVMIVDRNGTVRAQSDPMGGDGKLYDPKYLSQVLGGLLKEGAAAPARPAAPANKKDAKTKS